MKKTKRGGKRIGAGRPLRGPEKRIKISVSIEAESFRRIEAGRAASKQTLSDFVSAMGMLLGR
jgi:hypothetical protein